MNTLPGTQALSEKSLDWVGISLLRSPVRPAVAALWGIALAVSVVTIPVCWAAQASAGEPRVLVEGCQLELVAREPEIVTPIGLAFDHEGRLLVVESQTHQRPEDYEGPTSDRVRVLSDSDGDGKLDKWSTFAEGFEFAMNLAVHPEGGIVLVTRSGVHRLRDLDGDGRAEVNETLVHMETEADYPHNGLSGICFDGPRMYLGVGENFGYDYTIVGADGSRIGNTGGVGMVYHCGHDGSQLERVAEGFWNPFALCTAEGALYGVDNDPDASPPCRLIHVCPQGDYGFRFEYGRAGTHPLHAWNGELPGTLPMVCGTGEAPTALVNHRGYLWVTSWGDHRIECYRIVASGEDFPTAERTVVVQGEADFRPTGMAAAPDGSLYFGDWVLRDYPVHGNGRIWRLTLPDAMQTEPVALDCKSPRGSARLQLLIQKRWDQQSLSEEELVSMLTPALADADPDVRLFAVRWATERRVDSLMPAIERLLGESAPSERYYLAVLAALDWLNDPGEQRHSGVADGLLMRELRNKVRTAANHSIALRLIDPNYKDVTPEVLRRFLAADSAELRLAAVECLAAKNDPARFELLRQIVDDADRPEAERVAALVGLAAELAENQELFEKLAEGSSSTLAAEAKRSLRLRGFRAPPSEDAPPAEDLDAWVKLLAGEGDAEAGRRLFFHPVGPQCAKCHRHGGRGGDVGPDLTNIAQASSRERIVASILQPSREIAPHFQPWVLTTDAGKIYLGLRLPKGGDDGHEPYADTAGDTFVLASDEIESRLPAEASIMPAGLEKNLTVGDLRDLVAFLAGQGGGGD